MSILIKNMEMPKNCSDCPLNYDQMACKVTGTRWWSDTMVLMGFDSDKERLYDCPLVELPPAEPKRGKWIRDGHHIRCDQCGMYMCDTDREGDRIPTEFCPHCGADMREVTT